MALALAAGALLALLAVAACDPAPAALPAARAAPATTGCLPAAPKVVTTVTASMTTSPTDPLRIQTYNLIEPYAAPTTPLLKNGQPMLFVFLPGSLAQGCQYTDIVGEAAAIGYYAVALSYPNGAKTSDAVGVCPLFDAVGYTLTMICGNNVHASSTFDCYDQLRHNRFDGTPEPNGVNAACGAPSSSRFFDCYTVPQVTSPGGSTSPAAPEGIENRLYQLVNYLGSCNGATGAGWCSFIAAKALKYGDNVVLGGHSQGGGEAAYIAKTHAVSGVVMVSSPEDSAVDGGTVSGGGLVTGSADWLNDGTAWKTPLSRFYGLVHEQDEFVARVEGAWDTLTSTPTGGAPVSFMHLPESCVDTRTGDAGPASIVWSAAPGAAPDEAPCYSTPASPPSPVPPYGGAHRLYTNVPVPAAIYPYHDGTVLDSATPPCPTCKLQQHPLLTPAWRQMLYEAGGFTNLAPTTCGG